MIAQVLILSLFALSARSEQTMIITNTPDGYTMGGGYNAPIYIEAFVDLLCPDSWNSWMQLEPVFQHYNLPNNQTIRFTLHLLPLNYHTYAFIVAQGLRIVVDNLQHPADIWTYINQTFYNQANFYAINLTEFTGNQVYQNLTNFMNSILPAYSSYIANGLGYDNTQDVETRASWSYAISRGVTGTPTFFLNGVYIDGADQYNTTQWMPIFAGDYSEISDVGA
jgi:protein-disulfide isomerase